MGFRSETTVNAPKKQYRCYLCGEQIEGKHIKVFYVDGGKGYSFRVHKGCHEKAMGMCGDCYDRDSCTFDISECFHENWRLK